MELEGKSAYAIKRWELKDVIILLLIVITIFLAGWTMQSEKSKYIVIFVEEVEEKVKDEYRLYKAKSKDKIEEFVLKKINI